MFVNIFQLFLEVIIVPPFKLKKEKGLTEIVSRFTMSYKEKYIETSKKIKIK